MSMQQYMKRELRNLYLLGLPKCKCFPSTTHKAMSKCEKRMSLSNLTLEWLYESIDAYIPFLSPHSFFRDC